MIVYEVLKDAKGFLLLILFRVKWIMLFGFLFFLLFCLLQKIDSWKKHKSVMTTMIYNITLSLNISFVFVMTLFGRTITETKRLVLNPFASYFYVLETGNSEILLQIIMNIVMYIPLGCLLPYSCRLFDKKRNVVLMAMASSSVIEFIQYVCGIGLFEIDDILNNTFGAIIGVLVYVLCNIVRHRKDGNYIR